MYTLVLTESLAISFSYIVIKGTGFLHSSIGATRFGCFYKHVMRILNHSISLTERCKLYYIRYNLWCCC